MTSLSRRRMVHRIRVFRNTEGGRDPDNNPLPASWEDKGEIPCYLWSEMRKTAASDNQLLAVEDTQMIVPSDSDLTETDEVGPVRNRRGDVLVNRRYRVRSIQYRSGHLRVSLQAVEQRG